MKFCWTTLMVEDMERSLKFYTEIVGLKVDRRFNAGPNVEIAFLGDGETKVELIANSDLKEITYTPFVTLGFEVESLEKMKLLLDKHNIEAESEILKPNPHIQFFYLKDPDGVKIQFVENL